tara:strand:+ start:539 stop:823 length:285 start_codon:yes stop_codon:yes gene_type:complete
MKLFFILILLLFFNTVHPNEISPLIILENCKTCHGENFLGNSYLTSFKDLDKEEFLEKMYNYKSKKDNSVMSRIVKVLTKKNIKEITDLIYDIK